MINLKNISWNSIFERYIDGVNNDIEGDFAYEKRVNIPDILSICPEKAESVFDIGCGDGRFTKILTQNYKEVYAIDESNMMVKLAKTNAPKAHYLVEDIELKFPKFNFKFNLITAKLLLMYINDLNFFARNCYDLLENSGELVISVTHPIKWSNELKNYYLETKFDGTIANIPNLQIKFISRTIQTYINTFTKHGFILDALLETGVPDTFVLEYPHYLEKQTKPLRLNMRFRKI